VVVAGVTGASVAEAAIRSGTFAGKTSAADPVGFKVDSSGRVISFYYEGVHMTCSDKDSIDTYTGKDRIQTPVRSKFKVSSKGKWSIKARNPKTGFGWDVKAGFKSKGASASGTLKVFARFDNTNTQNPKGSITCTSGTLKWSAKRK
jgi:hypothetical protein